MVDTVCVACKNGYYLTAAGCVAVPTMDANCDNF